MSKKDDKVVSLPKKVSSEIFNSPPPDFVPMEMEPPYFPTRLEYFASRVMPSLLTGRSEKDRRVCAKQAILLAKELIEYVDSAESG